MLKDIHDTFSDIFKTVGNVVIAGGCVRDTLMNRKPKDYDIFILNSYGLIFKEAKKQIDESLQKYPKVKMDVDWHKSEPFLVNSIEYDGKEVQIMYRYAISDTEKLLDTFDWNVSLFAWDEKGLKQRENVENIGYGKFLKLQKVTYPKSTLRRGYRFSERFKMQIHNNDVEKLCEMVYHRKKSKEKFFHDLNVGYEI